MNPAKPFITACMVFLAAAILFLQSPASASTSYTVRKGDNPSKIAKKFRVSLKDLQAANQLDPEGMRPGDRLIIPAGEKASPAKSARKKAKEVARKNTSTASSKKAPPAVRDQEGVAASRSAGDAYHTVRKGDTLSALARKYATTTADIKELNGLRTAKLKSGQKLLVRPSGSRMYTVRKGDNIWKIAKKFDIDPDDLMEINQIGTDALKPGQRISLDQVLAIGPPEKSVTVTQNIEEEIRAVAESDEFRETTTKDKVVLFAKKLLDIPYKFGGTSLFGIDCSGYVKKVYGFLGVDLPRTAREQFRAGEAIDREELSVGDLVFFRTYASFPSHVGIYLGNNLFIHASSKGKKVTIDSLTTPYYLKRFIGGKRFLSDEQLPGMQDSTLAPLPTSTSSS